MWLLWGACVVAWGGMRGYSGGHAWLLGGGAWLLLGGHAWLLLGGACVVAPEGGHAWLLLGGMHGCSWGGMHGCSQGGHAWLLPGGHAWDTTRYTDTVNERAVRILLECILVKNNLRKKLQS